MQTTNRFHDLARGRATIATLASIVLVGTWVDADADGNHESPSRFFEIQIDPNSRVARVDGILNPQLADQLESMEADISAISISSPGGAGYTAHRIARLANRNGWRVSIEGACASACISLFLQAENASIGPTALFIAHSQLAGRLSVLTRTDEWNEREIAGYDTSVIDQALNIVNIANQYGPEELSIYAFETTAAIGPICSGGLYENRFEMSHGGENLFQSEYDYWLPTQETLTRWRGDLPNAIGISSFDETLEQRLTRYSHFLASVNFRPILLDDQVQRAAEWFRAQEQFELCE